MVSHSQPGHRDRQHLEHLNPYAATGVGLWGVAYHGHLLGPGVASPGQVTSPGGEEYEVLGHDVIISLLVMKIMTRDQRKD